MATPKPRRPVDASIMIVEETSPEERTVHIGACHCEAVKYEVTLKYPFPKYPVNECNCSICIANGYMNVYPCRQDVVFKQGYDNLTSYVFNTKTRVHKFCKTCGSSIMIDFTMNLQGEEDPRKDTLAMNVRHFKDFDFNAVEYSFFDGKNTFPQVDESKSV